MKNRDVEGLQQSVITQHQQNTYSLQQIYIVFIHLHDIIGSLTLQR